MTVEFDVRNERCIHQCVAQQLLELKGNGYLPSDTDIKQLNQEWEANFSAEVCLSLPLALTRAQNIIFGPPVP